MKSSSRHQQVDQLRAGCEATEPRHNPASERRAAQLAVINEVIRRINSVASMHDADDMARVVAEALHQRLGFSHTTVLWLDAAAQELVLAASQAADALVQPGYRQAIATGVMGRAVRTGEPQLIGDTRLDPDYIAPGTPKLSELCVPIQHDRQVLGVINLESDEADAFDENDVEIIQTVADGLAVALQNARLHQDLAERAAQLQRAYSQLEQVNRLKDEMIQNISHELRLPLTIIRGYLALILEGALGDVPPALHEALRTTSRRTDEIVEIVERITTLYGLRLSGLEMERLSLARLVRQAADIRRRAIERAGLRLEVELPPDELMVQGNAERLLQVLDSLLDNAIKFNLPGGRIHVRARESDGLISVEVTDTGIGIPADKLDQVWDYFYQVDGSTTRRYGGMGVGLALVKDVIEAHGGAVWVRSVEGQGSAFGFSLRKPA